MPDLSENPTDIHAWIAALGVLSMESMWPFTGDMGLPGADTGFYEELRDVIVAARLANEGSFAERQFALVKRYCHEVERQHGTETSNALTWWVQNVFVFDTARNRQVSDWEDFISRYPTLGPRTQAEIRQKTAWAIGNHVSWIQDFHLRLDVAERLALSAWDAQVLAVRWQWDPEFDQWGFVSLTAHRYQMLRLFAVFRATLSRDDLEALSIAAIQFLESDPVARRFNWKLAPLLSLPEFAWTLTQWPTMRRG